MLNLRDFDLNITEVPDIVTPPGMSERVTVIPIVTVLAGCFAPSAACTPADTNSRVCATRTC